MGKHKAPKRKLMRHQRIRLLQHYIHLVKQWINEQRADLPDIVNDLKNK